MECPRLSAVTPILKLSPSKVKLCATQTESARRARKSELVDHFDQQVFTDVVINVLVLSAADQPQKRAKLAGGRAGNRRVVRAHAIILSSKSAYFSRAIQGGWKESSSRVIEIELGNDEDFEAFYRLVKLSYCSTYTREGERGLEADELMQLIRVGNAFEFTDAVKECAAALQEGMDWERAVLCIELAVALSEVEELKGLRLAAQDYLATEAGMLHELFTPAQDAANDDVYVLAGLRLSRRIAALSIDAFEAMLTSTKLRCRSRNDVFWLIKAWLRAQVRGGESDADRQALALRLAKLLRAHAGAMTPAYVHSVVATDPLVIRAGLAPAVLADALGRELLSRRSAEEMQSVSKGELGEAAASTGRSAWTLAGCFTADDIARAASGRPAFRLVGLVAGYPWCLRLERREQQLEEEGRKGGALVGIYNGPLWESTKATMPRQGGFFTFQMQAAFGRPVSAVGGDGRTPQWYAPGRNSMWGRHDFFAGKTWDEVFAHGSPYLTGQGELQVQAVITQ